MDRELLPYRLWRDGNRPMDRHLSRRRRWKMGHDGVKAMRHLPRQKRRPGCAFPITRPGLSWISPSHVSIQLGRSAMLPGCVELNCIVALSKRLINPKCKYAPFDIRSAVPCSLSIFQHVRPLARLEKPQHSLFFFMLFSLLSPLFFLF